MKKQIKLRINAKAGLVEKLTADYNRLLAFEKKAADRFPGELRKALDLDDLSVSDALITKRNAETAALDTLRLELQTEIYNLSALALIVMIEGLQEAYRAVPVFDRFIIKNGGSPVLGKKAAEAYKSYVDSVITPGGKVRELLQLRGPWVPHRYDRAAGIEISVYHGGPLDPVKAYIKARPGEPLAYEPLTLRDFKGVQKAIKHIDSTDEKIKALQAEKSESVDYVSFLNR